MNDSAVDREGLGRYFATGCGVVDELVRKVDAYFRIGCWALSEIVGIRAWAGRVPYNTVNSHAFVVQSYEE